MLDSDYLHLKFVSYENYTTLKKYVFQTSLGVLVWLGHDVFIFEDSLVCKHSHLVLERFHFVDMGEGRGLENVENSRSRKVRLGAGCFPEYVPANWENVVYTQTGLFHHFTQLHCLQTRHNILWLLLYVCIRMSSVGNQTTQIGHIHPTLLQLNVLNLMNTQYFCTL